MDRQLAVVVKQQAREGLESLAMKHGHTVAAEVRTAIQRYLERTGIDLVDADPQLALLTA
jgi:predicted DNA-binding protein